MRLVTLSLCALVLAGCSTEPRATAAPPLGDRADRPNVVFVLTDDLSSDLIRFMPNVQRLRREGTSFTQFITSASLCCPSRASIFTGLLPHNTGVLTNIFPYGGVYAFARNRNPGRVFARTLNARGYRTAFMGKYLNGYRASSGFVPPGWTDWAGGGKGYEGFGYTLNLDGVPTFFGDGEADYLTDVIAERGAKIVDEAPADRRPFFLMLSTFTPHRPFVPAPRHRGLFADVRAPRSPAFNRPIENAPRWLAGREERDPRRLKLFDRRYRQRAQSVVSVDEMLGKVLDHLERTGQADSTYVMFGSDNGYHMGEHRLLPGKLTAFETDIRVPFIVRGPGVPAGREVDALVQNTDLAPTFEALAGVLPRNRDGRSLVGLMKGRPVPANWRDAALVEHKRTARQANDPDDQTPASGDPPTYRALRTRAATYVEYRDGDREYYDLRTDPYQLRNAYGDLGAEQRARLSARLRALVTCRGAARCATAPDGRAGRSGPGRPPRRPR